jgi:hypothetical protein
MPEVTDYEALAREARRIYFRYAVEVVEEFTFCPWARSAREAGRVECNVVLGGSPTLETLLAEVQAADARTEIDVTLLIMPECSLSRIELRRLTSALHARYETVSGRGRTAHAIADFHPAAPLDQTSPERLVPFIRRSPDPTLQLIKHAALESARRGPQEGTRAATLEMMLKGMVKEEPPHARIANANFRTLERLGSNPILAALELIAQDRLESYTRAGATPIAWDGAWDGARDAQKIQI